MKILNSIQGSSEWLLARSLSDGTASELPAAAGESSYTKRTELLQQKFTGIYKEADSFTQALFAKGHLAEDSARKIAEKIIDDELYPITVTKEIDGLNLLASLDGATMTNEIIFEHKLYNKKLADNVANNTLDLHYTLQMDQQLLVSGAEKCLFMCSDGTEENMVYCWYYSDEQKLKNVVVVWKQFKKDLAEYVPAEIAEAPKAETIMQLPAINVQFSGALQSSNLADVTIAFDSFLEKANTTLVTDEDFANGEATAKFSRETAKKLKLTRQQIIDQVADISEATRIIDLYAGKFDTLGLQLEKLVKSEKEAIKIKIMNKAVSDYAAHKASLESEISPIRLVVSQPNFAEAMKNKRTLASLNDSVNTELAAAKINADAVAKDIRAKLAWCKETSTGFGFLFNDLSDLIYKAEDDFKLVVTTRIEAHKKAETEKAEEQRKRIQAEEEAKAKANADAELEAERAKVRAEEQKKIDDERRIYIPPVATIKTNATVKVTAQNIDDAIAQKRKAEDDRKNPPVKQRPSDDEILQAVAFYFNADEEAVLTWFTSMDLERLCIKAEA